MQGTLWVVKKLSREQSKKWGQITIWQSIDTINIDYIQP